MNKVNLSSSTSSTSLEFGSQEWAEAECLRINSREGNPFGGYDCPICRNKGYVEVCHPDDDGIWYLYARSCDCQKLRNLDKRIKNCGLGDYLKKDFGDYIANESWQSSIVIKAHEYLNDPGNLWWCIVGQSGAGKTLITSIIANNLLRSGKDLLYITWTDFIGKLKRDMMSDKASQAGEYLDRIENIEVLFLDEILKKDNETDLKYLIEIVNYRYRHKLKTLITSEREIKQLLEIDEATFGRVVEMTGKYLTNIAKDQAKNYRLKMV